MFNNFDKLPLELLVMIFSHIELEKRISLREVNKLFLNVISMTFNGTVDLGSSNIDDNGLKIFKGVRKINLSGCKNITDVGLQHLKGVHMINLSGCNQITDAGLKHLSAGASPNGRGVHFINLNGCSQITNVGLKHLRGVYTINLNGCFNPALVI